MKYVDSTEVNYSWGLGGEEELVLATKFNAGKDGFNVADVGTWFIAGDVEKGKITAEIKAGGNSIYNAVSLAKGSINYDAKNVNKSGRMYKITLDTAATIYPNEDFYVIFTYPLAVTHPQGMAKNDSVALVSGRYLIEYRSEWYDLQDVQNNEPFAWVMYAAEKESKESGWLKIMSTTSGMLDAGGSSKVDVKIEGTYAVSGDQSAYVVFKSNDTNHPSVGVPVTLHFNEAPIFNEAPETIYISENETVITPVTISDKENHTFTIEMVEKDEIVSHDINGSVLTLTLAPKYGDAGTYSAKFRAIDQHNASREYVVNIVVSKTNRSPIYTGDSRFAYVIGQEATEYSLETIANDPDGDSYTFTATVQDENIATLFVADNSFIIKPKSVGETKLILTLKDVNDAVTTQIIDIAVEDCMDPTGIIVQKWNSLLLVNNTDGSFKVANYQWYKNGRPIEDATKQYYSSGDKNDLDFSAGYYVRLETTEGKIIFTCPYFPVKKNISLKAYPNPVKTGQSLKVEAQLPDLNTSPITIQIVNLSGQVIKTLSSKERITSVQMPYNQGLYLVRVSNDNISQTFNVRVE